MLALAVLKMLTVKIRKKMPVEHQGHIWQDIGLGRTGPVGQLGDFSQRKSCQEAIDINENERKGHSVLLFVQYRLCSRHA